MDIDFKPHFQKYEELRILATTTFDRLEKEFTDCVKCKVGCSDCCHAVFDLTLVEAIYISRKFNEKFDGAEKEALLEKCNKIDRKLYKIKKQAYKDLEAGRKEFEIMQEMGNLRIRCPLLDDEDMCLMYEERPITCRLYGVPTSIGGEGATCGLSAFEKGEKYPTVNLDVIHNKLYNIANDFVLAVKSRYSQMGDMLVPLSMALLTNYDESYLGVGDEEAPPEDEEVKNV